MEKFGFYSEKVIEHFKKPHNFGRIENASAIGKVGNIYCGDLMQLYLKIGKNKKGEEFIEDIKFETFGCAAAISTSSAITDLAKGKTIKEAMKIDKDNVVESLGGLPPIKIHCSLLAADALAEAIYDYFLKNKKQIPEELKKRHQKIEKGNKILEERYKKWNIDTK